MNDERNSKSKIRIGKDLFISCFVLVLITAIGAGNIERSMAQVNANPGVEAMDIEAAGAEAMDAQAMVAEAGGSEDFGGTIVSGLPAEEEDASAGAKIQSITFKKDWRIQDALQFLAARYKRNIVPSSKVDGLITVTHLYDVTFDEALNGILGYGFKYEQEGNFIKVYTAEEHKMIRDDTDRMIQKVFTLYYVNSAEMEKLIRPVLSSGAIVAASTAAATNTEAGDGGDTLAMNDTIVVYDYPENIEKVSKVINEIDVKPSAVLIEVTILEAELTDETEFGVDFSSIGGAAISLGSTEGIQNTGFAGGVTGTVGLTAAFSIDDVTGFIRALEGVTDTTVLANPKIIALNKQAGHILIGAEDGYLTTTQVTAEGRVQQVEFLESGTTLKFRPYICKDGYIRMEISPEQSEGGVEATAEYVLPWKKTTQVSTNIMVKDGKTIVIGGLFKEETKKSYSQVPLLGDLPLIGPIFRQVHDTTVRKELIVLITPHIIYEPEEAIDDEAEEIRRITEGARKSLSQINRSRIFEDRYEKALNYYNQGYPEAALSELDGILELRPNFPDAARLREKIISEIGTEN